MKNHQSCYLITPGLEKTMPIKTDRLRKLESELEDLNKWLTLGMVPKKDIEKHKEEIALVQEKIDDELAKIEHIRQNGHPEEFVTPKRQSSKLVLNDGPSISDMDVREDYDDVSVSDDETYDSQVSSRDTQSDETQRDDDNDPFHERNRWKKRDIIDPEVDDW